MVVLRPRLAAAVEMLENCRTVADIGCDHGRLCAFLLQNQIAKHVIGIDISVDSLKKAFNLCEKLSLEEEMELRVGNGLTPLALGEAEGLVLCGMGGTLIADILEEGEEIARSAKRIVMQPMRGTAELRKYLFQNHYRILDERLVFDAERTYQLISAVSGTPEPRPICWPDELYKLGWVLYEKQDPMLLPLAKKYLEGNEKRLRNAPPGKAEELRSDTDDLRRLIALMEEK